MCLNNFLFDFRIDDIKLWKNMLILRFKWGYLFWVHLSSTSISKNLYVFICSVEKNKSIDFHQINNKNIYKDITVAGEGFLKNLKNNNSCLRSQI